MQLHMIKCNLS